MSCVNNTPDQKSSYNSHITTQTISLLRNKLRCSIDIEKCTAQMPANELSKHPSVIDELAYNKVNESNIRIQPSKSKILCYRKTELSQHYLQSRTNQTINTRFWFIIYYNWRACSGACIDDRTQTWSYHVIVYFCGITETSLLSFWTQWRN